jgi:hypothetical protein
MTKGRYSRVGSPRASIKTNGSSTTDMSSSFPPSSYSATGLAQCFFASPPSASFKNFLDVCVSPICHSFSCAESWDAAHVVFETYWMKSSSPLLEALIGGDCWTALELPPERRKTPPNIVPRTPIASCRAQVVSVVLCIRFFLCYGYAALHAIPNPPHARSERVCCPRD